uniref:fucose mutarotase isoform X1 n=1 Tax=Nyctereutes procyonoides TaxID=34880 RepID=UPI002443D8FC|nr:fucose mutarotase isoform X1 [Nyctereutes procyonoides]
MVVLKGVPALLSPELLYALARMGHGDEIVLADVNFPTASICKCGPEELRADGGGDKGKAGMLGDRGRPSCRVTHTPCVFEGNKPVGVAARPGHPAAAGGRAAAAAPGHLRGEPGCRHGAGAQRQEEGPSDSRVGDLPVHPVGGRLRGRPGHGREVCVL